MLPLLFNWYDLCAEERSANSRNSSDAALNRARVEQLEFSGWLARLGARCMDGPSSTTTTNFRHFVGLPAWTKIMRLDKAIDSFSTRFSQSRWWKLSKVIILAEISYDQIYFLEIYKILKLYKYYTGQIVIFFRSNFHEDFSFYNIIAILLHVTVARNSIFFILYRIRGRPYHIVSFYLLNLIYSLSFHDSIKNWTDNGGEGKGKKARCTFFRYSAYGYRMLWILNVWIEPEKLRNSVFNVILGWASQRYIKKFHLSWNKNCYRNILAIYI